MLHMSGAKGYKKKCKYMCYVHVFVLIILAYKHTQSELVRSGASVGCAAGLTWPSQTEIFKDMLNLGSDELNGI